MNDHRENIFEAAKSYLDRDPFGDDVLEARVLVGNEPHEWRVEWLLAMGGPTVWVVCDSRHRMIFCHSWGKDRGGHPLEEIEIWDQNIVDRWEVPSWELAHMQQHS